MFVRERKLATTTNWHYQAMDCPHNFAIDCCMEYRALGAPALTNTGEWYDTLKSLKTLNINYPGRCKQ